MGKVLIFKGADFSQNAIDGDKDYVLTNSITFDGSHYINLGRGLTQQSKVEISFTPTVAAVGDQLIVLAGVRTAAFTNQMDMRIIKVSTRDKFAVNLRSSSSGSSQISGVISINSEHTLSVDIKNNNIVFDGTTYPNAAAVDGFNTGTISLYIGAYNQNGSILSGFTYYTGKIHYIKIYDNGVLSNYYNAATVKATGTSCLVDRLHDENKYYFVTQ